MAKKQLVWAIDCDDVLVPTADVVIDAYNQKYGTSVELSAFYNDTDNWGAPSHKQAVRRVSDLLYEGIADSLAPTRETVEALQYLASVDEIHMVTGRQTNLEPATHRMLERYLPGIFRTVEHTNYYADPERGFVSRTKGEVCAAIGADVLIDDHIVHASSVLESGLQEVIVWGDYPWNHDQKLKPGMVRCVSWEEVFRERERILADR